MSYLNKKIKAFTLIELLISLFIITILVSIVTINYKSTSNVNNLINIQSFLYQNLKLAQNYALSNKSYNNVLPEYWGIYFSGSDSRIFLFADLNGNAVYDDGEAEIIYGGSEIILPKEIIFRLSWEFDNLSVLFKPGDGHMFIYNVDESHFEDFAWHIELKEKNFDIAKLIIVEPPARIDISNCSCFEENNYCCSFCPSKDKCIDFESL